MKLEWKSSPPHPDVIAYVSHGRGYLIRIEYLGPNDLWLISVLNGIFIHNSQHSIHQMETVKEVAERYYKTAIADLTRNIIINA